MPRFLVDYKMVGREYNTPSRRIVNATSARAAVKEIVHQGIPEENIIRVWEEVLTTTVVKKSRLRSPNA